MPQLIFLPHEELCPEGKVIDAEPGTTICDAALANGVQRVHVISHRVPDSLLLEVFTNEGTGTLVVNDISALTPAEQASEQS